MRNRFVGYRARSGRTGRTALAAVAVTATVALALSACGGGDAASAGGESSSAGGGSVSGGTLRLAATIDSGGFDTALIQNGNQAQYWTPVYDTLLLLNPDATIAPGLATKWEYNDDSTVLTLTLREGVKFTDGAPFDAAAVKANLEHLKGGTGQNSFMVKAVDEVVVKDPQTAELHLSAPDPALLTYLTMAGGAEASPQALTSPTIATTPVGSGPYMLDPAATEVGATYAYVRNPDYYDKDAFPYDKVTIAVMPDLTARMNALRSGQIDGGIGDGTSVEAAKAAGLNVGLNPVNRRGLILADRDGTVVPELANVKVRQAINYAIDGDGLLKSIQQGFGETSTQIFNPLSVAWDASLNDKYPYDPAKAKQLMAEAGYADGFDITLPENAGEKSNAIVAQQLGEIGIRVNWEKVDGTNYVTEVQSGKYGAFWMSLSIGDPWWDLTKQVMTGPWNPFKTSDPELDKLLATAKGSSGDDYAAALKDINAWLVDNAWFDIWYVEQAAYFTSKDVDATMHAENVVPYIRDFKPAS